ncbi:NADPH-dependent FMN reductase [Prauserella sp. PE36]|uniref:NADPH-dependent oxidoreductase n=1 Tax=Prauserella endophytica TaxID=1592324 RepID=A0ABY2S8W9_9PSEU|nr:MULTISPECIES: NAD(P)H-dependent oxidoreductase [Prauserella]RBM21089.1 NADPH-dependent FMN reductase [Prauserella sp. PE36]TKG72126.1 NADPH-dependent oxidoreductase [Prauserella endophytica]
MTTTVVAGNPKPASRTLDAGERLAEALTGRPADHVIDVVELGPGLLGWGDETVTAAVETVRASSLAIFASPTFKATYTGLLKLFLDQFAGGTGLRGVVSVPLMLGAGPGHALAPDLLLKPVLSELGGTCALPGLYLVDSTYTEDSVLTGYAQRWAPTVAALTGR